MDNNKKGRRFFPDGSLRPSCEACIATHDDENAPLFEAPNCDCGQIGWTTEDVSDRSENMDVELPGNGFLSERELNLLQALK